MYRNSTLSTSSHMLGDVLIENLDYWGEKAWEYAVASHKCTTQSTLWGGIVFGALGGLNRGIYTVEDAKWQPMYFMVHMYL